MTVKCDEVIQYIKKFSLKGQNISLHEDISKTKLDHILIDGKRYTQFINEFWSSKQRQGSSIHEISYRACFKPGLPNFFIELLTEEGDTVYDPFSGRGTTAVEAGLLGRNIISNDINPLSKILTKPRFFIPKFKDVKERLCQIHLDTKIKADLDLSMFYHPKTEGELVSLRHYLNERQNNNEEDNLDAWIRMVATTRLAGHSKGFFSVYTLPPNQAVSQERQIKINCERNQKPEYRDIRKLILRKSRSLIRNVKDQEIENLYNAGIKGVFMDADARETYFIEDETVDLTVTSPPFLDVVQYHKDNWLRCWFNAINSEQVSKKITMSRTVEDWCAVMQDVFYELYRITKKDGWVAFEVGEVRGGKIKLDEYVVPLGINAGFSCVGILINSQEFTKTSNIWGVKNNNYGTNTNRVVLFVKGGGGGIS
ncbi:MAG TPA: site-specific DNA-methyltransferase [Thermoanaerobacterales bacterium]|nr:site-specific DNA-methyltransferase [Thermoanaerobacterales bacterium]